MSSSMPDPPPATLPSRETEPDRENAARLHRTGREEVIPILEEVAHVEKREVTTGKVRVHTRVDVVQERVGASLQEETVEVTRVPVGREIDHAPEVRTKNGVTIVPVVEEVLVVEKRLILKEELHIRRNIRTENVEIPVELRKQKAEVEHISCEDEPS